MSVLTKWPFLHVICMAAMGCGGGSDGPSELERDGAVSSIGVTVSPVQETALGGATFGSSSKLQVSWSLAPNAPSVVGYRIELTPTNGRPVVVDVPSAMSSTIVTDLMADTIYIIQVRGCFASGCADGISSGNVSAATAEEHWQVQGTGGSAATATRLVSDSNTKPHAFVRQNTQTAQSVVQLYYDTNNPGEKGVKLARTASPPTSGNPASAITFTGQSGYGLIRSEPMHPIPGVPNIGTSQAVPIAGAVRLFMEGENSSDGKVRIFSIDSKDGDIGFDFNSSAATRCETALDYQAGGGCALTVWVGPDGDASIGVPGVNQVRQFKIGYPTMQSWQWDQSVGTFMLYTAHMKTTDCSSINFNVALAAWDGAAWKTEMASATCPKLLQGLQAISPMHLSGVKYKAYYSENKTRKGDPPIDPANPSQPKVVRQLYGDGARSGNASLVEFDDWDPVSAARDVVYHWPDGTILSDLDESKFDDFQFLAPTGDLAFQVMYTNMSSTGQVFIGAALLLNP